MKPAIHNSAKFSIVPPNSCRFIGTGYGCGVVRVGIPELAQRARENIFPGLVARDRLDQARPILREFHKPSRLLPHRRLVQKTDRHVREVWHKIQDILAGFVDRARHAIFFGRSVAAMDALVPVGHWQFIAEYRWLRYRAGSIV